MSEYLVIYEQADDGGWGASLPDLPGVVALGASRDEVADGIREARGAYGIREARGAYGIREALGAYAADLADRGLTMAAPHHSSDTIAA